MEDKDVVFLCETHCNVRSLAQKSGFIAHGDPAFPLFQKHGGLAVFIKDCYDPYVNNVRFSKCTISFSLTNMPNVFFMGVYIYPTDSSNHDVGDFGIVIEEIRFWLNKGFLPYIGGDFNSRIGNFDKLSAKTLKWRYSDNIDQCHNPNHKNFMNMCELLKILPLNHCIYKNTHFQGHWTYFKANRKVK